MCGRYIPNTEEEIMEIRDILSRISIRLSQLDLPEPADEPEVYPTQIAPIIVSSSDEFSLEKAKWGFAKWDNKGTIINAKSETLEVSSFFRAYAGNRCIIPAHGYYEWETLADRKKIKYTFTDAATNGIFMAGVYRPGPAQKEFVILTKGADENLAFIHDRMPLILKKEQIKPWLCGTMNLFELQSGSSNIVFEKAM
jgi:putative SOS response-associated peptidase YedK